MSIPTHSSDSAQTVSAIDSSPRVIQRFYTAAQGRALDERACRMAGAMGLMQQAGRAAYQTLRRHWPGAQRFVIACGGGNNGGDGYVVATLAQRDGLRPVVWALVGPEKLTGEAQQAALQAQRAGVLIVPAMTAARLAEADVIVDALLGTGVRGTVSGDYAAAISALNHAHRPILALDLPSGLQCDNGQGDPIVTAQVTVTFITHKPGLHTGQGPDHVGILCFEPLEVDTEIREQADWQGWLLDRDDRQRYLPPRRPSTHKGHCGHLVTIGGAAGYGGAAILCAEAAARLGAGKVSLATDASHLTAALVRCPELMVRGVRNAHDLQALLSTADIVAIGPGLGQQAWGEGLFDAVLMAERPCVIDADGLHLLQRMAPPTPQAQRILTPHPGEAAMLLDCSAADVQRDRLAAAQALWQRWGGVIVLKGNGTLVVGGDGPEQWALCPYGNPGMASGGMGDVLGGMIASLWAQGLNAFDAACMGVLVHAMAADDAVAGKGPRGLLASDLAQWARRHVNPEVTDRW